MDAVAADARYKGRELRISGEVTDIGAEILGAPYVTLDAGQEQLLGIQALFPRGATSNRIVAAYRKGQVLLLHCRVRGKLLHVLVDDCTPAR